MSHRSFPRLVRGPLVPAFAPALAPALAPFIVLVASSPACAQWVDQTATLFPTISEYTNQLTIADIDGDGDNDIVWANGGGYSSLGALLKPRIYINSGTGKCTDETDARALGITGCFRGVEAGDCDGDGDLDLVLAQDFNRRPLLLINNGAGVFSDQTVARLPNIAMSSARAQFADVDNDGDLDLAFCNSGTTSRFASNGRPRLFLNDGNGVYADAPTAQFPSTNLAEQMDLIFGDVDGDLDLDMHIGTRGSGVNSSQLWINDGAGNFSKLTPFVTDAASYSYDFGDIDGDGDLDLLGANAGTSNQELLLRNGGNGTSWTNISSQISPNPSTDDNDSVFIDYDDDGDLDLLIGSLGASERLYRNDGTGVFTQVTGVFPVISNATLDIKAADMNGDGKPDVITAQGEAGSFQNRIYINTGAADTRAPVVHLVEQVVAKGSGPFVVRTEVSDGITSDRGFDDDGVFLVYSVDGGKQRQVAMRWAGNGLWRGEIPAQDACAGVSYFVRALDRAGNAGTSAALSFTVPGSCGPVGDLDGNGAVDAADLAILLNSWGGGGIADLDGSGTVDASDMSILLSNFG